MKAPRRWWKLAVFVVLALPITGFGGESVALFGKPLVDSAELRAALTQAGFNIEILDDAALSRIDERGVDLLIVGPETPCPPESRQAITRLLERRAHVFVIGPVAFDFSPHPVHAVSIVDLKDPAAYTVAQPKARAATERYTVESTRVSGMTTPNHEAALAFRTEVRGMNDTFLRFPVPEALRAGQRSVLTFSAQGDAYADLLAIEAVDKQARRWVTLVPIAPRWQSYAVSWADFLPRGWKDGREPAPRLAPAEIISLSIGTEAATIWREKPMAFAVGEIALAENEGGTFAPSARLTGLRWPFREIGMEAPSWLFNPFEGTRRVDPPTRTFTAAWRCPPPLVLHAGVQMGTDTKAEFDTKADREQRRIELLRNAAGDVVAELRLLAGGPHEGACVGLFGLPSAEFVRDARTRELLVATAAEVLRRPKIIAATINTTAHTAVAPALPRITVRVRNPLRHAVEARLRVAVAGETLRGDTSVSLPPKATTTATIELNAVPSMFHFEEFDWGVTLATEAGTDELRDGVAVERALLHALAHLVRTQQQFPDGRISHHYFGDAYGVRALFAYLDLVRRQPERLQRNRDLWAATDVETLRACGLRFVDMLLQRQNKDGSVPMGYGEQGAMYNVADGGQISLALGQIAPLLDPARREACWQFCRKFAAWAETFYLDESLARELQATADTGKKAQARAGHYGLGSSRGVRNPFGPSWVLPDILGVQLLLTYVSNEAAYRAIADRNIRAYLQADYAAAGYFHAEAFMWAWRDTTDPALRGRLAGVLEHTFVPPLLDGRAHDMYELGARGTLRALPMIYYRRWIKDTPELRAALLKYVWAFASESSERSMRRLAEAYPKPQHGEAIAASKFASFSAIWAMELLEPGSSFLRWPGFPRESAAP